MAQAIKRPDAIHEILAQACARNEMLIIATPFLRFESFFVGLDGGDLHVAATMTREDASFGLRSDDLKIRFPMGEGFMEAPVKLLGMGIHEGRRTLRLAIPRQLKENDYRADYRVERVGRVAVTCGTLKGDLLVAALVDLSTRGTRIHAQRDLDTADLKVGMVLVLSIPLSTELRIEARGEIRHLGPRDVGVQFAPPLPEAVLEPLSRWVFRRREEDLERRAQRLEANRWGERRQPAGEPIPGILFVSADPELEEALRETFQGIQPVGRIGLSAQALKDALAGAPLLAIFQVTGAGLDERRRLKALVELASAKVPVLLLGTDLDGATLFQLAGDWKAASAMVWNPARAVFLQRLAQGIIRQKVRGAESPLAPPEA